MSTLSKRKPIANEEGEGELEKGADEEIDRVSDERDQNRPEVKDNDKHNLEKEKDRRISEEENSNDNNTTNGNSNNHKKAKTENATTTTTEKESEDEVLEDFEVGASPFVTQTEATQQYCLPAGTLAVCTVVEERPNPRNPRWAKVKLYARSEIRQRAHKRHGGREGLRAEREKRAQQRYEKDARGMKDLFL